MLVAEVQVSALRKHSDGQPGLDQQRRTHRVGMHRGPGVGPDQCRKPLLVEVVGVLVGDEDRIQVGEVLETRREAARVDEDAAIGQLDEEARVPQVRDAHDGNASRTHGIPDRNRVGD